MLLNLADWYLIVVLILSFLYSVNLSHKSALQLNNNRAQTPVVIMLVIASIMAFWLGFRPIDGGYGDTYGYAIVYDRGISYGNSGEDEWGFGMIMDYCRPFFDASGFFVIIALGYFLCTAFAMKKLLNGNAYVGFLIFLGAFSTFSYATNGIRNGLACSILTIAIVLVARDRNFRSLIFAALLAFVAMTIHRSTILPIMCLCCAVLIKNRKIPFYFWILSIFIFFTVGNSIGNYLSSLGFDDRMTNYLNATESYSQLNKTGFRPDFLLYSVMPIVLGYYVIFKKELKSRVYELLLFTYIFSNSVWVMIMNISFSNRFAYLSWFLYPIVLAYPCFEMNIWNQSQGKFATNILLLNVFFTAFMQFIYY